MFMDDLRGAESRPECAHDYCNNLADRKRNGTFYEVCNTCRRAQPLVRRAVKMARAQADAEVKQNLQVIATLRDQLKGRGGEALAQSEEAARIFKDQQHRINKLIRDKTDLQKQVDLLSDRLEAQLGDLEAFSVLKRDFGDLQRLNTKLAENNRLMSAQIVKLKRDLATDRVSALEQQVRERAAQVLTLEQARVRLTRANTELENDISALRRTEEENVTRYSQDLAKHKSDVLFWKTHFFASIPALLVSLAAFAYATFA